MARSRRVATERRGLGAWSFSSTRRVGEDSHGSAAFRTWRRNGADALGRVGRWRLFLWVRCRLDLVRQKRATEREPLRSMAIGEESEVPDAMEAVRQDVSRKRRMNSSGVNRTVLRMPLTWPASR
jgi:hypothetical protein